MARTYSAQAIKEYDDHFIEYLLYCNDLSSSNEYVSSGRSREALKQSLRDPHVFVSEGIKRRLAHSTLVLSHLVEHYPLLATLDDGDQGIVLLGDRHPVFANWLLLPLVTLNGVGSILRIGFELLRAFTETILEEVEVKDRPRELRSDAIQTAANAACDDGVNPISKSELIRLTIENPSQSRLDSFLETYDNRFSTNPLYLRTFATFAGNFINASPNFPRANPHPGEVKANRKAFIEAMTDYGSGEGGLAENLAAFRTQLKESTYWQAHHPGRDPPPQDEDLHLTPSVRDWADETISYLLWVLVIKLCLAIIYLLSAIHRTREKFSYVQRSLSYFGIYHRMHLEVSGSESDVWGE